MFCVHKPHNKCKKRPDDDGQGNKYLPNFRYNFGLIPKRTLARFKYENAKIVNTIGKF